VNWATDFSRAAGDFAPTPKNDPRLLKPVKVRVLRPFCVRGARVEPDQVLELPRHDATSLAAIGKLQILE
jgi:hypothetical protein